MIGLMMTILRALAVVIAGALSGSQPTAMTMPHDYDVATFAYDAPSSVRIDTHLVAVAEASQSQLSAALAGSASLPADSRGPSTTPSVTFVATNTVSTPIESGNYVVSTPAGEYVGQSGNISTRLKQHVASGKFTQAEVDAAQRFAVPGTKLDREIADQLLIDSKGGIDNLLNKVNPIGPKRFDVMPNQPYVR
jgi:hypothetical protein